MKYLLRQRIKWQRRQRIYQGRSTYPSLTGVECRQKLCLSHSQAVTVLYDLQTIAYCPYTLPVAVKTTAALHLHYIFFCEWVIPASLEFNSRHFPTCHKIHAVTSSLVRHAHKCIKIPMTPASQNRVKEEFWAKFGFPRVLGCTHMQLRARQRTLWYTLIVREPILSISRWFAMQHVRLHTYSQIILDQVMTPLFWPTLSFLQSSRVAVRGQWLSIKDMAYYTLYHAYRSKGSVFFNRKHTKHELSLRERLVNTVAPNPPFRKREAWRDEQREG